jgi:hypothetical protein
MQHATPATVAQPDPRPEIARRVRASSVYAVSRELGIPREQIARLAGFLDVRASTLALARERLAQSEARSTP